MSYILDALNKSDQERQRERTPNLKTIHGSSKTGRSVNIWKVAIFLLLTVNLVLVGVWLKSWRRADPADQVAESDSVQTVAGVSEPDTDEATNRFEDQSLDLQAASNDDSTNVAATVDTIEPTASVQMAQSTPLENIPEIHELPRTIRSQIPDLAFASHIYASNPRSRMVSINGRSMREGDGISEDLTLQQITPEGVILQIGDYVFQMSILRDWSFE